MLFFKVLFIFIVAMVVVAAIVRFALYFIKIIKENTMKNEKSEVSVDVNRDNTEQLKQIIEKALNEKKRIDRKFRQECEEIRRKEKEAMDEINAKYGPDVIDLDAEERQRRVDEYVKAQQLKFKKEKDKLDEFLKNINNNK